METKIKTVKLSANMKEVVRQMRAGKLLFYNYGYQGWYLDQEPVKARVADALFQREIITMVVNISMFARYELTKLGKSISL